ncbi:MAG: hypothetical protein JRH11_17395 [Deltaproteobacteria bacterium]|nr:hypothetical protein [Deltaproteobacteria bacterium]
MTFELRVLVILSVTLSVGCGAAAVPTYPLAEIRWQDDDMHPFGPQPPSEYNSWLWDAVDNSMTRPLAEVWLYRTSTEAVNVNALDEVPDSSWFINRLGRYPLPESEFVNGACGAEEPVKPWRVLEAKADGTSPGLLVQDANGDRYIFKVDYRDQEERGTASDSIATRMLHVVGYSTPCNRVVVFDREDIILDPALVDEEDEDAPTPESVAQVLAQATAAPGGRLRGSLSAFIQGDLLGGWSYSGTRDEDPNDIIDHRDRREIRGQYVLSAWLNHVDARDANNMDVWVDTSEGRGYIRHFVLDAGDSFGIIWPESDAMSRRLGHARYLDIPNVLGDFLTLGLIRNEWDESVAPPKHPIFGYYEVDLFDPDRWKNGYSNPAYQRRTERDSAWMARILSRFGLAEIRAVVSAGNFSRPEYTEFLVGVLEGRRQKILERFLTRLSPLSWPDVEGDALCLEDLAVSSGMRTMDARIYTAHLVAGGEALTVRKTETGMCVTVPGGEGTSANPGYVAVSVVAATAGRETNGPIRVHLYRLGEAQYQVVGLERIDG